MIPNNATERKVAYVIAVIAKCPIAGQSKTRLQSLFSGSTKGCRRDSINGGNNNPIEDGSAILAKAMLCDVILSISYCCRQAKAYNSKRNTSSIAIDQLLFYAPPTAEGYKMMCSILSEIEGVNSDDWTLLPVDNTNSERNDVVYESKSSNLSNILSNVVKMGKRRHETALTSTILFGMDAPELPINELYFLITQDAPIENAFLCPAMDGGYVMLSIPPLMNPNQIEYIFQSVRPYWSHQLTAITQIKAMSDVGIYTIIGPMIHDIDTPDDIQQLILRLQSVVNSTENGTPGINCCLFHPSKLLSLHEQVVSDESKSASLFCNQLHGEDDTLAQFVPCKYIRAALNSLQLLDSNMPK